MKIMELWRTRYRFRPFSHLEWGLRKDNLLHPDIATGKARQYWYLKLSPWHSWCGYYLVEKKT